MEGGVKNTSKLYYVINEQPLTCPGPALITADVTTWCSCLMAVPSALSRIDALLQDFDVGVVGGGDELRA